MRFCTLASVTITMVQVPLLPQAAAVVRYVDVSNTNASAPYTNWATAATNIQDAVDAAVAGDEIMVTNGIYATGGRAVYGTMTNRVAVDKPLALRSVNGPQLTVIQGRQVPGTITGDGAIRCVYLTNGASLSGFTLRNGGTRSSGDYDQEDAGGGLWCESTNAIVYRLPDYQQLSSILWWRSLSGHPEQLRAGRQLGSIRRWGDWRHAQQLYADGELCLSERRGGI